ncbi:MAG: hypothetical protein K0S33_969 [Bacteroidetes bacterium]|jgi:hypothetical protein|nr:hypothetical protein [Bacteroidota bacterium]
MENKYKEGDVVYAKANPVVKLVIRRYVDEIYYCRVQYKPELKEQVYFERELSSDAVPRVTV